MGNVICCFDHKRNQYYSTGENGGEDLEAATIERHSLRKSDSGKPITIRVSTGGSGKMGGEEKKLGKMSLDSARIRDQQAVSTDTIVSENLSKKLLLIGCCIRPKQGKAGVAD
jgi:hypothetical protein